MYRSFRYFCSGETTTSASPIANNTEENYRLAYGFTKDKGTSDLSAKFQEKIPVHVVFKCDQTTKYVLFLFISGTTAK